MNPINVRKLRQTVRLIHCLQKERGATCAASAAYSCSHDNKIDSKRPNASAAARNKFQPEYYTRISFTDSENTAEIMLEVMVRARNSTNGALAALFCADGVDKKFVKCREALNRIRSIFKFDEQRQGSEERRAKADFRRIFVAFNSLIGHIIHEKIVVSNSFAFAEEIDSLPEHQRGAATATSIDEKVLRKFPMRNKSCPFVGESCPFDLEEKNGMEQRRSLPNSDVPSKSEKNNSKEQLPVEPKCTCTSPRGRCSSWESTETEKEGFRMTKTYSLMSLLLAFIRLKESAGIERGFLSALLASPCIPESSNSPEASSCCEDIFGDSVEDWEFLLNDLVLELENQRSMASQLQDKARRVEEVDKNKGLYRSLLALVEQSIQIGPELSEFHDLVRKDLDLKAFRKTVNMETFWGIITVYIDRLHALELLIIEEIESSMQNLPSAKSYSSSSTSEEWDRSVDYSVTESTLTTLLPNEWAINLYELKFIRRLGRGGAGTTYYAKWHGEEVAVKVAAMTKLGLTGWKSEVQTLRRLHHPNIIRLLGCVYSERPKTNCLVLEYCDAGDLTSVITGACPPNFFNVVAKSVSNGMAYLHDRKVMHRDIKPDNVLLHGDLLGGRFSVKLTDFGLATAPSEKEHTAETGTYRYMAPEIIRHQKYSFPSDVYSFGLLVWEVITREQPFEEVGQVEAAGKVALEKARPPFPDGIPTKVKEMVEGCWREEPDARLTFKQVCEMLQVLEGEGLDAREREWMKASYGHPVYNSWENKSSEKTTTEKQCEEKEGVQRQLKKKSGMKKFLAEMKRRMSFSQ